MTLTIRTPVHADVHALCEQIWKLEKGLLDRGVEAPALTMARDVLAQQSHEIAAFRGEPPYDKSEPNG